MDFVKKPYSHQELSQRVNRYTTGASQHYNLTFLNYKCYACFETGYNCNMACTSYLFFDISTWMFLNLLSMLSN